MEALPGGTLVVVPLDVQEYVETLDEERSCFIYSLNVPNCSDRDLKERDLTQVLVHGVCRFSKLFSSLRFLLIDAVCVLVFWFVSAWLFFVS